MADQVRWLLAATQVSFTQRRVSDRESFLRLSDSLLPFQQLPVLQIDGQVLAQSQAMVRYLAKRGDIAGTSSLQAVQMDMLAEYIGDMLGQLMGAPFVRFRSAEEWTEKTKVVRVKWSKCGHRLEDVLQHQKQGRAAGGDDDAPVFLVGSSLSYADVLAAHLLTWVVEELGADCVRTMPLLVDLQRYVISLPHMAAFIKSDLYYPVGDDAYVNEVNTTLGRICG
jgi:glutathione S-transferase